jgi:hypothetical protein
MTLALTISLCMNAGLGAWALFLGYLLRQVARVVRSLPPAFVRESPVDVQAAIGMVSDVTGLTAAEAIARKKDEEAEQLAREIALFEELGVTSDELRRATML